MDFDFLKAVEAGDSLAQRVGKAWFPLGPSSCLFFFLDGHLLVTPPPGLSSVCAHSVLNLLSA